MIKTNQDLYNVKTKAHTEGRGESKNLGAGNSKEVISTKSVIQVDYISFILLVRNHGTADMSTGFMK